MSDLIDREAILKHIEKTRQGALMMDDIRKASIVMMGMNLCEEAVGNHPSAQPERKMGKWIEYNATGKNQWMCSECCAEEKNPKVARFCYWCGAEMERSDNG